MKLATFSMPSPFQEVWLRLFSLVGASHILFGDVVLLHGPDSAWGLVVGLAQRLGIALKEHPDAVADESLFLVVQVGSLFQYHNPDVPVVLNRGRHLAVLLHPEQAREIIEKRECCYKLFPLAGTRTVIQVLVPPLPPGPPLAWMQALVGGISTSNLETKVAYLAALHSRHSFGNLYNTAAAWAKAELESLRYSTDLKPVTVGQQSTRNVVADKLGRSTGLRDLIVVTAHLDSINREGPRDPLLRAPGADDNGSGVAGILEMARLLSQHEYEHDLRFVLFGGEEQDLYGSRQYVMDDHDLRRTRAVINMDMIGKRNRPLPHAVLVETPFTRLAHGLAQAAATYSPRLTVEWSTDYANSDHVPFINARPPIPAALTIEASGDAKDMIIHTKEDTPDKLDPELMRAILRMNVAFVAESIGLFRRSPVPFRLTTTKGLETMTNQERPAETTEQASAAETGTTGSQFEDARLLRNKDHLPPITLIDGSFILTSSTVLDSPVSSSDPARPHRHRTQHPLRRIMVVDGDGTVLYRDLQAQGSQIDIWLQQPTTAPQPNVRVRGFTEPTVPLEIDADLALVKNPLENPTHPARKHVYGHPANQYNFFINRIRITKGGQTVFECNVPGGHEQGYEIWIWDRSLGGHEHIDFQASSSE